MVAAVALALVLLKVFTGNQFFTQMEKFVVQLMSKASASIP